MSNQLLALLQNWHPQRDETEWVLGTVYKTEGSCYRKAGAMMLFSGLGQQPGLLSGGCLEPDIQQHARRVMRDGRSLTLCYDAGDEDDLSFKLGIGCGGIAHILLQPVTQALNYLDLELVMEALQAHKAGFFHQYIPENSGITQAHFVKRTESQRINVSHTGSAKIINKPQGTAYEKWLLTAVSSAPHIMIIGGGYDAQPVINMASEMGWETTLWDSRPANARREYFIRATTIVDSEIENLASYAKTNAVDAVILMTHNVKMDAQALSQFQILPLRYMALLGPPARRARVLKMARLKEADLRNPLSGPAGLNIGGELPESIALAILSECHAVLMNKQVDCLLDEAVA